MSTLTSRTVGFALVWALMVGLHAVLALHDRVEQMLVGLAAAAAGVVLALALRRELSALVRDLMGALMIPVTIGVVLLPLGPALWAASDPVAVLAEATVWPALLVLLMASRALGSLAALAASASWHGVDPVAARRGRRDAAALQEAVGGASARLSGRSIFGPVFMGGFLCLGFYSALALGDPRATDAIADPAIGETPVNVIVVFLFCVVLAEISEAWLALLRDRALLDALARRDGPLDAALGELSGEARSTLAARRLSAQRAGGRAGAAVLEADATLERAARRYIRTLIAALPMTGFAGTVIGLTASLGALPGVLDSVAEAGGLGAALSGALGGLSTAFETTLLGLAGSLVATLLLAGLERAEAATEAASDLIAAGEGPVIAHDRDAA